MQDSSDFRSPVFSSSRLRQKHPFDKPVGARKNHNNRPCYRDLPSGNLASSANQRQGGSHDNDDGHLTDLDTQVEGKQGPAESPSGQVHFGQDIGKTKAVDEPEDKRNPGSNIPSFFHEKIVEAHIDDAEGDRRLDDSRRRRKDVEGGQRESDAVRDRERRYHNKQAAHGATQQQQPNQEQQVIRADQNMVDAFRNKP